MVNQRDPIQESTDIQGQAADPRHSVVLAASAGSGKTKVLVDRFLRLCIEETPARCHPRAVLAITFTKKAAVEIQERLLREARAMALCSEAELDAYLEGLFHAAPTAAEKRHAAGLFELILEDTAGLNVGTIHSFCQNILGRFAAEAGLDPHFSVLEDPADLVEESLDQLAAEISLSPELSAAAALLGKNPDAQRKSLKEAHAQSMRLGRWMAARHTPPTGEALLPPLDRQAVLPELLRELRANLFPEFSADKILTDLEILPLLHDALRRFLDQGIPRLRADLADVWNDSMERSTVQIIEDVGPLPDLVTAALEAGRPAFGEVLIGIKAGFLTKTGKARSRSRLSKGGLGARYNAGVAREAQGILLLCRMADFLELYRKNEALLTLLVRLLDIMDNLKRRDRKIDFQDLEDLACRLMADEGRALGLLHRLDDGLHHILLDEFQDTNFNQWDMLKHLVLEFLAGRVEGDVRKSVFVVGDVKQSIYGFRAAEPEIFGRVAEHFVGDNRSLVLPTNFRSLRAVVDGVGDVFNSPPLNSIYADLESRSTRQLVARCAPPGEAIALAGFQPADDDDAGPNSHQLAADAAARLVKKLMDDGETVTQRTSAGWQERPLTWGDVLILCRSRSRIGIYEKAFRQHGIPITAAGRGMLAASREVQDILALLRWLVYPADEVALATVLRSPLFRLGEEAIQGVLAGRGLKRIGNDGRYRPPGDLWKTLRQLPETSPWHPTVEMLGSWRARVGREDAHSLLRRIYRDGFVLERFEAALGRQARENLMRLFDLSLAPEVAGTPTIRQLGDVIERAARRGGEEEADTPVQDQGGRVRFMTIHGSKGLQAPVVILADATGVPGNRDHLLRLGDGDSSPLLFMVRKEHQQGYELRFGNEGENLPEHPLTRAGKRADKRRETESANLLYVAMTRAEERLYLLGGAPSRRSADLSMLDQVREAAASCESRHMRLDDPVGLDRDFGGQGSNCESSAKQPLNWRRPDWWDAPRMGERYRIERPSTLDDHPQEAVREASAGGVGRAAAMERGNRVHLLLQLAAQTGTMPPGDGPEHREAAAVFNNPDHRRVFKPDLDGGRGLCEAPIITRRPPTKEGEVEVRTTGSIDRLVVGSARVDIIDFKTNRTGGDVSRLDGLCDHYRPQLAAYRAAIAQLYPGREIRTWLLFTDPQLPGAAGLLKEVLTA